MFIWAGCGIRKHVLGVRSLEILHVSLLPGSLKQNTLSTLNNRKKKKKIVDNSYHLVYQGREDEAPSGASRYCYLITRKATVE